MLGLHVDLGRDVHSGIGSSLSGGPQEGASGPRGMQHVQSTYRMMSWTINLKSRQRPNYSWLRSSPIVVPQKL